MNWELSPRAKQEKIEQADVREWFRSQYGDRAQVRVRDGEGWYSTTVNRATIRTTDEGEEFVLEVPVDGSIREFVSDRPDHFEDLELIL